MMICRTMSFSLVVGMVVLLGFVFGIPDSSQGQTILVDNFDDGDDNGWFRRPLLPEPLEGIFDASSLAYNIRTSGPLPDVDGAVPFNFMISSWETTDPLFRDNGVLRSKIRVDAEGNKAALYLRGEDPNPSPYEFSADAGDGVFRISGDFRELAKISPGIVPPFGVGEDWFMEAGAVGNQLTLKVWPADDPEPAAPQLQITDSLVSKGTFGVGAYTLQPGTIVDATFDDIYWTVPEPSSSIIVVLCMIGVVSARRRTRTA